jgi:hypothetical protein
MSFMPNVGARVRMRDGRIAMVVKVGVLSGNDRVRYNDDGNEVRVTAWDIAEVLDDNDPRAAEL